MGETRRAGRWMGGGAAVCCVAAAFCAVPSSCSVYDASLLDGEGGPADGTGIGWWSGDVAGCFSARAPTPDERPSPQSADELAPIYLALSSMRLGSLNTAGQLDDTAWRDIGFDLDNTCTSSNTCPSDDLVVSCAPQASAVAYDGDYCRDNTFGRLEYQAAVIPEIAGKYGFSDDAFNCALCVGDYNFIIRLSGYNGTGEDDTVRVDLYPSPGLQTILPWNCANGDWKNHPCFTADQPWTVRDDVLADVHAGPDLADSAIFDANAYVHEGYLVLQLPDGALFWFPGKNALATAFPITIHGGVVSAKLARAQDGTWGATDGIIAGKSTLAEMIHAFRLIGFCENDSNYSLMETFVSGNLDILADGTVDPNRPCDSMSLGIGFTATQATAGAPAHVDDLTECPFGTGDGGADASDAGADASDAADSGG